jgi:hypothetical protein
MLEPLIRIHSDELLGRLLKLRANEQSPTVPGDWNKHGGFFSKKPTPWGSFEDARRLIAFGKVSEGRELFRRLLDVQPKGSPYDKYLAAHCGEMLRPPRNAGGLELAYKLPTMEKNAISAIMDFATLDASGGLKSLLAAMEGFPSTDSGAILLLIAFLAWSDTYLQTQILYPRGKAMEFMVTIAPVHGTAALLLRHHQEAWNSFVRGVTKPELALQTYEKELAVKIEEPTKTRLSDLVRIYCWLGEALVLRDLCFDAEAQAHFSALVNVMNSVNYELTDPLRSCCALLGR